MLLVRDLIARLAEHNPNAPVMCSVLVDGIDDTLDGYLKDVHVDTGDDNPVILCFGQLESQ